MNINEKLSDTSHHSTLVYMHDHHFSNMPGALFHVFLRCLYALGGDAVEKHWMCRACCLHAVDAQWQLFAHHEHAMSAPWPHSQTPVRTLWERGGTLWALVRNAMVTVGAPWHLHVMENVKLFAIFSSIFVRSHHTDKFQIVMPTPWDRGGVWQGLNIE